MWQRYAVAAIFSPVFTKAKFRLKKLLHNRIIYSDGLRPDELAYILRNYRNVKYFFEDDLTQ